VNIGNHCANVAGEKGDINVNQGMLLCTQTVALLGARYLHYRSE